MANLNGRRRKIWSKTGGKCWYCGHELWLKRPDSSKDAYYLTLDHIIPQHVGGDDSLTNMVPCCRPCNSRKRERTVEQMRWSIGKALGVSFDPLQTAYLESLGVCLPEDRMPVFYFETMGWEPDQATP